MNKYLSVWANLVSGSLLVFAALAKAQNLHFDMFSAAKILIEVCLGAFILHSFSVLSLRVALLIFSAFVVVNVWAILIGESTCGCMGEVNVPAKAMLLADLVVVGLIVAALRHPASLPITGITGAMRRVAVGSVIAVAVMVTLSWSRSQTSALLLDRTVIDVGTQHQVGVVERAVRVTNRTAVPVKILSVSPPCSIRATDLNWVVGPQMSKKLPFEIPLHGTPGAFKRHAEIYFDCPIQTKIEVIVKGRFVPSN